ncbi:MAG: hypothetical protein KC438_10045 [Thermomicrobiales bacterium]|nr:hypothetical protein [Thermomicrobiales bacterium]
MNSNRFDTWTRTRSATANRRSILGWSLTAGVAAALTRLQRADAQFGDGSNGSCTYAVTLTSSFDSSQTVSGTLVLDMGNGGAIDTGSLSLAGQGPASVVGQATGPAVDLLAALGDGTALSLTGVASGPIEQCSSPIVGFLANPDTGQLGTWRAESSEGDSGQTSAPPALQTQPQTQAGSQPQGGDQPGSACLELHSQCNTSSECCSGWCTDNECRTCSDTICGESCIVLSDNLAHCGACFNACDVDTQSCVGGVCTGDGGDNGDGGGGCIDFGGACSFSSQCCSGWCNGGTCDSCGLVVCNDMCVDTFSDSNNCGNCNNTCIGTTCLNGSCQ